MTDIALALTRTGKEEGGPRTMAQTKAQTKKATMRPLHDRVLLRRIEEQEARNGSIIIPDSAKEKPQEGQVIAVGQGRLTDEGKKIPLDVKAGGRGVFGA